VGIPLQGFALGLCGIGEGRRDDLVWRSKRFSGGFVLNVVDKPRQFGLGGGQIGNGVEHAFGVLQEDDAGDFAVVEPDFDDLAADHVGRLQGVGLAQIVDALGVAGNLHLRQFLLVIEPLHHVIALHLGVVYIVFLDGQKRVGEGLEAADFLLLHLHFHGIAAESGERIPHHGVAVEVERRIAAVKRERLAGARGGLLAEGHLVDGLHRDGLGRVAVVMQGIAFDAKQVFVASLVGYSMVPHRKRLGISAVMGMIAPHLPLV
ncbi:MAG: hypothetical protein RLZZ504_1259, partial [Bacteroidota bacterium]